MGGKMMIGEIENGTVIDHISAASTFKVLEILRLEDYQNVISVGVNLESRKMGRKGMVKIAGKFLTAEEASKIALISPEASLNIIKSHKVERKVKLSIPEMVEGIVRCVNPECITNHQKVPTRFHVSKNPLSLRCHFCERVIGKADIELV